MVGPLGPGGPGKPLNLGAPGETLNLSGLGGPLGQVVGRVGPVV